MANTKQNRNALVSLEENRGRNKEAKTNGHAGVNMLTEMRRQKPYDHVSEEDPDTILFIKAISMC